MTVPYAHGLHQLSQHCHAWLQPDGSWGLSNTGLIAHGGESLLIDTLFDLGHTREMLHGMSPVTHGSPIRRIVNTHADGDHFYGNQLVEGAERIASAAAADHMNDDHLNVVRNMLASDAPGMDSMRRNFARFDFSDVVPLKPTTTFHERLTVDVGGLPVELIEMPPAHTNGDVVVFVASEGVLYSGDILFIEGAPIAWAGPLESWAQACEQLIALDPVAVVPGHGPVTDVHGIARVRDYLRHVDAAAQETFKQGLSVTEAARAIDMGEFDNLRERGRLLQNILNVYRHLDPQTPAIRLMYEIDQYEEYRSTTT